jgi:hypothetical protein
MANTLSLHDALPILIVMNATLGQLARQITTRPEFLQEYPMIRSCKSGLIINGLWEAASTAAAILQNKKLVVII